MTTASSFERSLEQWLHAEAPAQAPNEILASALERVSERRQDRYVTQRLFGDQMGSSRTLRFVALTAVTALLVVALAFSAFVVGGPPTAPVPPPVATPSPAATPTPAALPTGTPIVRSAAGAFEPGPELLVGRGYHTATRLLDGRILILGGESEMLIPLDESTEIWNPNPGNEGSFVPGSAPLEGRASDHTATLLPDGRVLVVGGQWRDELNGVAIRSSAELWNPETGSFSPAGEMAQARLSHSATLLPDGRVLIAGGWMKLASDQLATLEIWDPATLSFSSAGHLTKPRADHDAFVLSDGRVMFIGEEDTEFWDPTTGETVAGPELVEPRYGNSSTMLTDGRVLVAGGMWGSNEDIVYRDSAEIWDGDTNSFELIEPLVTARAGHQATLLADGRVLISGGGEGPSFEIWDPVTERSDASGRTIEERSGETATLLDDGRVLIVGSVNRSGAKTSTEFWDPNGEPLPPPLPTPTPDGTPTPPPVHVGD